MPTYVQVSQSEVQWQGDNEEPLQNLCTPKSTPVRIVKKLSLSPGIVTIKKKHSFDLLSLQRLEPTPPQKEILDDSFESYTSQDFELTDEELLQMIEKTDRDDESYEVQGEQFDWSEEQIMQAVKSVEDEEKENLKSQKN